jgi:hypothetical protein
VCVVVEIIIGVRSLEIMSVFRMFRVSCDSYCVSCKLVGSGTGGDLDDAEHHVGKMIWDDR